ncbi:MAG TPA: undecaprenyl/decaprenyl-phosphate alpha-N-acetylglucosaminyl 1-phosphate transferase [Anaerolineales bacterium]|nr:undecaprenyl/decaprenyl-phosphate alpha-N-acetylglucosaminyl 1-phosphate transferase [Anaerolineae bacterium]HIP86814.1 undecaprenyl/decaprenyl-phosphate alpha-N-acetylglucosaminyl 1-phosphate transferase [Anaerolineales bacterium]
MTLPYAVVFAVAAVAAAVLTPFSAWIGRRLGLVDRPGGRRTHRGEVPRLGGLALFLAFVIALGIGQAFRIPTADPNESRRLLGLILGSLWMFLVGLADDRWDLSPAVQILAQLVAGGIAIATLIFIERVNNPLTDEVLVFPPILVGLLTLFWVAGMINTVNWLDGLDGLAAGVGAILCIVLAVHMHRTGQPSVAILPLALLGATVGFLPYNFHPARVFMGSTGAFFLGYALAALGIIAGARVATVLLVMGVPIVDVAWQILNRLRHRRSPARADRGHLHYRLLDLGLSQRTIVLAYWAFCGLFGLLALSISSRLYKLIALLTLGGLTAGALTLLSRRPPPDR